MSARGSLFACALMGRKSKHFPNVFTELPGRPTIGSNPRNKNHRFLPGASVGKMLGWQSQGRLAPYTLGPFPEGDIGCGGIRVGQRHLHRVGGQFVLPAAVATATPAPSAADPPPARPALRRPS